MTAPGAPIERPDATALTVEQRLELAEGRLSDAERATAALRACHLRVLTAMEQFVARFDRLHGGPS
ncbi:MAG TPA: hypothetical protein VGW74_09420 [Propionibacteriaceae bacterium]|nr:hypothetical protein [Propionibacteriaceae bacterium]